jgi:hypothetical protein
MMGARFITTFLVVATLALSPYVAQAGEAQPGPSHADWFGFYKLASGNDLAGFTPENQNLRPVVVARLQPWARLKMEQTNGVADDTGAICQLKGFLRTQVIGGFLWLPTGNQILMVGESSSSGVRRIFLDRPHPKYPPPTWLGHSIGRWEDDTLVIDTVGFNDKTWLTLSMQPHTEDLHIVERIRPVAPGLLELRTVVEDRQALTSPYTFSRYYKLAGREMKEEVCAGEPGDMRMWSEWRQKALRAGMVPLAKDR